MILTLEMTCTICSRTARQFDSGGLGPARAGTAVTLNVRDMDLICKTCGHATWIIQAKLITGAVVIDQGQRLGAAAGGSGVENIRYIDGGEFEPEGD